MRIHVQRALPFVLPACLAGCRTLPAPSSIPFSVTEGGLLTVQAQADTLSGLYILDTGAGLHVLAPSVIHRLAADPVGPYSAFRHTGERVDFPTFRVRSLKVGRLTQPMPLVGSLDLLDTLRIAGILSAKLFELQPITLDFGRQMLFLDTPASLETRIRKGFTARIGLSQDRDKAIDLYADFLVADSVLMECELDTGTDGYVMDARFMRLLGIGPDARGVVRRESKSLFGQNEIQYRTKVSNIRLREARAVSAANIDVVFKADMIKDCLVGTHFWRNRVLTLDISHRRLIVSGNEK